MIRMPKSLASTAVSAALAALAIGTAAAAGVWRPEFGPSTSTTPYVVPTEPGVATKSILTEP